MGSGKGLVSVLRQGRTGTKDLSTGVKANGCWCSNSIRAASFLGRFAEEG